MVMKTCIYTGVSKVLSFKNKPSFARTSKIKTIHTFNFRKLTKSPQTMYAYTCTCIGIKG